MLLREVEYTDEPWKLYPQLYQEYQGQLFGDFSFDPELCVDTAYHIRYENKGVYTEKLFAAYQVCRSQSN